MANKYAEAWASIAHGIGNGLSFANDLMEDAQWFGWELLVKWAAWLGRGLANTIDFAGDIAAWTTDLVSWGINAALGTPENASDYSSKEWFIDKANKHVQKWFDQIEDATKSKVGKTFVWEKISDWVWFVGEMVSPMGIVGKAGKWAKIAKEYVQTVKNSPKALAELKALVIKAKGEGREVIQSEVDDVLKKYGAAWKNIAKEASWKINDLSYLENIVEWSDDITQEVMDFYIKDHGKEAVTKAIEERFLKTNPKFFDTSYWDEFVNPSSSWWNSDQFVKLMRLVDWSKAVTWEILDPKAERFLEKVASYSPEEVASKWPKIAAMMKAGKFAGKVWAADILREMSQPEIDAIEEEINGKKVSEEPAKEVSNDGITFPDMPSSKDFNPSEWSKFNKVEDTQTVSDKKKELELLKEKNAWDLNMATSVVDLMRGLGVDSRQEARKVIFEKMTGKPYTASAEDNIKLKSLVEEAFSKGTLPEFFQSIKR